MSTIARAGLIALLPVVALGAAELEALPPVSGTTIFKGDVRARPVIRRPPGPERPPPRPEEEIEVVNLPTSMFDPRPPSQDDRGVRWTISRTPPRPTTPRGAIPAEVRVAGYVKRTATHWTKQGCGNVSDFVRLDQFMSWPSLEPQKFRVSRVEIRPVTPPSAQTTAASWYFEKLYGRDVRSERVNDSSQATRVIISAPVATVYLPASLRHPELIVCHSEYYLRIWLIGPKDVDPLTGVLQVRPLVH